MQSRDETGDGISTLRDQVLRLVGHASGLRWVLENEDQHDGQHHPPAPLFRLHEHLLAPFRSGGRLVTLPVWRTQKAVSGFLLLTPSIWPYTKICSSAVCAPCSVDAMLVQRQCKTVSGQRGYKPWTSWPRGQENELTRCARPCA